MRRQEPIGMVSRDSITANQVTPALKSLFDPTMPTGIRCFAVLEGGNSGKILTDDPDCPQWGYVWEADDGTLYQGGTQDRELLARVVSMLRQDGLVSLAFRDGDPSVDLFPPDPDAGAPCLGAGSSQRQQRPVALSGSVADRIARSTGWTARSWEDPQA